MSDREYVKTVHLTKKHHKILKLQAIEKDTSIEREIDLILDNIINGGIEMSDYMNVKSENFQKFLDHHLKKQKDELIVEFSRDLQQINICRVVMDKSALFNKIIEKIEKWEVKHNELF